MSFPFLSNPSRFYYKIVPLEKEWSRGKSLHWSKLPSSGLHRGTSAWRVEDLSRSSGLSMCPVTVNDVLLLDETKENGHKLNVKQGCP